MYNFLYINTHDTGKAIQPYGYSVPTASLQQLAEEGTLFTHAYCCGPTCSPSRAAMLTGTYPHQNGMLGLAQRGFSLNNPEQHLASYLKSQGYQTALSGIQHEAGWYLDLDEEAIQELGYQFVLTTSSDVHEKEELHNWDYENALAALAWLDELDESKPFMLSYGMHSTHRPYPLEVADNINPNYVKPGFPGESNAKNRFDYAQFMTSAQYADRNVELLINKLKEKGLYEKTVILYTTDHGLALPFHKSSLKDTGIGVGLILWHPEFGHGKVIDELVSHIDVFPTICDILNLEKPDYLEGQSFIDVLEEKSSETREFIYAEVNFHTSYEPIRCVRSKRYKYIRHFDETWQYNNISNMDESEPKNFLLDHELKVKQKDMEALYDCYYDPDEMNNLINDKEYKELTESFRELLLAHMKKTDDPLLKGELEVLPRYKVNKKECLEASSKNPDDYDPRGKSV